MATTTTPAPAQPAQQQQVPAAPFVRVSEMQGAAPGVEECVVFVRSFGPWNRGVSAGFNAERAAWLYRHGFARPLNARTDRTGFEALIRK